MQLTNQELFTTIVTTIGVYILLCAGIIRFMFVYQRRRFLHEQQLLDMQKKYEEESLRSQLEVQEQTRLYIGRELHDNIGTMSSLIKINLNLAEEAASAEKRNEWIGETKEIVKKLIVEVKQLSRELNTDRISGAMLSEMLQQDITRIGKLNLFGITLFVEGEEYTVYQDTKIILYRICQELLHNILKHAQPTLVEVFMFFEKEKLRITITDDGRGFDEAMVSDGLMERRGSGLINLQNRAKLIRGKLSIISSPGNGTKCYIEVPTS